MKPKTRQVLSTPNLSQSDFEKYLFEAKSRIDSELAELTKERSDLTLRPQLEYAILSEGKRLRPLLILLSAESVGADRDKLIPLALAFELMHTATLVHDDIIDQDDMRRGRLSVHRKWSTRDAILTGDALISLAVDLASEYGETVLKAITQSALELCDGAHKDIIFSLKDITEKSYFKKIREKSASLFKASAFCGAMAAGGTDGEVDSLSKFAENLGIAYQLRDDIIDLSQEGEFVSRDLKSGVVSLPLLHTYALSSPSERQEIEKNLQAIIKGTPQESCENVRNIMSLVLRNNALHYCEQKIDSYLIQATDSLSPLKNTKYKQYLAMMAGAFKTFR